MKKQTSLCKWEKEDITKNFEELVKIVSKPKFVCKKCARAAKSEEYLCKPLPITN